MANEQHFYVFSHWIKHIPVYERTCDTESAAKYRVKELWARGLDAFYCSTLPPEIWY